MKVSLFDFFGSFRTLVSSSVLTALCKYIDLQGVINSQSLTSVSKLKIDPDLDVNLNSPDALQY